MRGDYYLGCTLSGGYAGAGEAGGGGARVIGELDHGEQADGDGARG